MAPASGSSTPTPSAHLSPGELPTFISPAVTSPTTVLLPELSGTLHSGGTAGVFVPFPEGDGATALAAAVLEAVLGLMFCWDRL